MFVLHGPYTAPNFWSFSSSWQTQTMSVVISCSFPSVGLPSPKLPYLENENGQEELFYSPSLMASFIHVHIRNNQMRRDSAETAQSGFWGRCWRTLLTYHASHLAAATVPWYLPQADFVHPCLAWILYIIYISLCICKINSLAKVQKHWHIQVWSLK